jgi:uncharacterized protein YdhG (YjbR/CyaY superfamily)
MGIDVAARSGLVEPQAQLNREDVDVSAAEIDQYLAQLEEPKRTTLQQLREAILRKVPDAEECISYGLPAFRVNGKVVAGFAAFKNHLSYLPHSGSVLDQLGDQLIGYTMTKGSLHFPVDQPLPDRLVERLVAVRLRQIRTS